MCCKKSHFIGGLLLGSLMGSVLALIFAPAPGKETREKIKKTLDENEILIGCTKDTTENLINKTKEAIECGFEKLTKTIQHKKTKHTPKDEEELKINF
jgi:gas vesicle protein